MRQGESGALGDENEDPQIDPRRPRVLYCCVWPQGSMVSRQGQTAQPVEHRASAQPDLVFAPEMAQLATSCGHLSGGVKATVPTL